MNAYRFDGKYTKELENDHAAFEEAVGYHDDRDAGVEKWCGPMIGWAYAASPVYQPQYFYRKPDGEWVDGGWVDGDGMLLQYDDSEK